MVSPIERFSRRLAGLEDQVRGLSRTPQLAYSSIENGSVDEYDADGNLAAVIGKQFDGSHGAYPVTGPAPPTPSLPAVSGGISLNIGWDGMFTGPDGQTDATIPAPMDFTRVEVHASRETGFVADSADTLIDTIESPRGGVRPALLGAGTWFVVLVSRSASGKRSEQSAEASAVVRPPVTAEEVQDLQDALDGKTTTITSTAEPSGDAAVGAVWQQEDVDHNIIGMWRYQGGPTPWQRVLYGDAMLSDVTASKVTAGTRGGGRVQIDEDGLQAWDAANVKYLTADAIGLTLVGTVTSEGTSYDTPDTPASGAQYRTRAVLGRKFKNSTKSLDKSPGLWLEAEKIAGSGSPTTAFPLPAGMTSSDDEATGVQLRSARHNTDNQLGTVTASGSFVEMRSAGAKVAGYTPRTHIQLNPRMWEMQQVDENGNLEQSFIAGNNTSDPELAWMSLMSTKGIRLDAPKVEVNGAAYGAPQTRVPPPLNAGWSQWTAAGWNGIWIEQMGKLTIISGAVGKASWAAGETIAIIPARFRPANKASGNNCEVQPNGNLNIGAAGSGASALSITYFAA